MNIKQMAIRRAPIVVGAAGVVTALAGNVTAYTAVYQPEDLFSMAIDFGAGFFGGLVAKAPLMGSSTGILIVISLITAVLLLMVFVIAKVISAIGKVTSEARKLGGSA